MRDMIETFVRIKVQSLVGQLNTCSQRNLKNKRPFFNRCRRARRDESVHAKTNGIADEGEDRGDD